MRIILLLLFSTICTAIFAQIHHWESVVLEGDEWQYLVPEAPLPLDWNTLNFDASNWFAGPGGFGYSDEDDETILPEGTISCFQRHVFNITDLDAIRHAVVQFDYDDAIVGYLNGTEIFRRNITSLGPPAWNQFADETREATLHRDQAAEQHWMAGARLLSLLQEGENVLAIQTHNDDPFSSDFSSRIWLHLAISDMDFDYRPVPDGTFRTPIFTNNKLPLVVIETVKKVIPDEPKITARLEILNSDTSNLLGEKGDLYSGWCGIEVRGSTSAQLFPKVGYGIETRTADGENNNVSLFGMPAENDWVLHGPYSDKTLLRNVLSMYVGRVMGRWAPRTQLCEVVINGDYRGVYVFMEKIKRDNNRVPINKLNDDEVEGEDVTGGYIVKIDKTTGGDVIDWRSSYLPITNADQEIGYIIEYPKTDDIQQAQKNYIQQYFEDFEAAIFDGDLSDTINGYQSYIDVPSFVDYILLTEFCRNVDGYRLSTYFYKDKNGPLVAGPPWDYNLAWGNADYCNGSLTEGWGLDFNTVCPDDFWVNPKYWSRMAKRDASFANALHCRWDELRQGPLHTDSLRQFIDEQVTYLGAATTRNFERWPILSQYVWPNNFIGSNYAQDIGYLKSWVRDRANYMDRELFGSCGEEEPPTNTTFSFRLYPNPVVDVCVLEVTGITVDTALHWYNSLGQLVRKEVIYDGVNELPIGDLPAGVYHYTLGDVDSPLIEGRVVVQ